MTPDEADKKQEWAGMDGAIAFHMIRRHAYDRSEIGVMMEVWRRANSPAWRDAPTVPGLWLNSINGKTRQISTANIDSGVFVKRDSRWYGPIPEDKP